MFHCKGKSISAPLAFKDLAAICKIFAVKAIRVEFTQTPGLQTKSVASRIPSMCQATGYLLELF